MLGDLSLRLSLVHRRAETYIEDSCLGLATEIGLEHEDISIAQVPPYLQVLEGGPPICNFSKLKDSHYFFLAG